MTIGWGRRIVRLEAMDLLSQQQVVLDGLVHGWILDAQFPGIDESVVDMVFRRARPMHARDALA
jgi:hypothetical protein